MTPTVLRPVPAWVRVWAIITVLLALVLLALGGFVTSFRAGMADPVWPTEPWFLFNNRDWNFNFVVEHTHRLAGWIVGLAVTLLAIFVWRGEPNRTLRWGGFLALAVLLLTYGEFHRGMGQVWSEIKTSARDNYGLDPRSPSFEAVLADSRLIEKVKTWPAGSGTLTLFAAIAVLGCGVAAGMANAFGGWLRCLALAGLVAVMIQGLLGGFRVLLNPLAGQNLAAIHGLFGQVSFCILVAIAVLAAPRRAGDALPERWQELYSRLTWGLVALLFVQLIWAVMLRHGGSAWAQQMHLLFAFAITAAIVAISVRIWHTLETRPLLGRSSLHLLGLLGLQLVLGVEAYLGKFAATGPQAQVLPELRSVSRGQATTRTLHQLIGCGLLASAVALALRASRRPEALAYEEVLEDREAPPVAALAFQQLPQYATEARTPDAAVSALRPTDGGVIR